MLRTMTGIIPCDIPRRGSQAEPEPSDLLPAIAKASPNRADAGPSRPWLGRLVDHSPWTLP